MKINLFKATLLLSPCALIPSGCTREKVTEKPNILIVMGDDISFPHMGAYGTGWVKTPGFDRVAKEGLLFMNAYTPNAKSSPSRACFLTGLNSWQLEEAGNHVPYFPQKFTSFMEALEGNGYFTGYTAKGWAPGVAVDSAGNKRLLTGKAYNSKKSVPETSGISDIDYAANFDDFLNERTDNKPFCFWYGSTEPHRRYETGSGAAKGGMKTGDIKKVPAFLPDDEIVRNDLLDYAYEIEHFDNHLVRMLDLLEQKGELDNTIIIVTADNGMPFPRAKGQVYEYSNHIPLAIMWKKGIRNPGREIFDYISFIDMAPTILETAGMEVSASGMHKMQGNSFTDIFRSGKKGYVDKNRNSVLLGKERHDVGRPDDGGYSVRSIIEDGFLYIKNNNPERWPAGNPETGYLNCDGSPTKTLILNLRRQGVTQEFWKLSFAKRGDEELYNLGSDADCIINLAIDPSYNALKRRLADRLFDELLLQEDPRIVSDGTVFDRYPYADNSTRDFYNRYMKKEIWRKTAGWVDSTDFETAGF